jgi:Ca2+/Na+ antiporter
MDEGIRRSIAYLLVVGFFMMIIGPFTSLEAWILGLITAFLLIPVIVILGMSRSRKRTEADGGVNLIWRGMTEDEWKRSENPDDFEGEDD